MKTFHTLVFLIFITISMVPPAEAGSAQNQAALQKFKAEEITAFAKQVEKTLAEKRAVIAIVARQGRPENELPPGINYTHTCFWVYSRIQTERGQIVPGYAVYNLYQRSDEPTKSELVQDFPINFLLGVQSLKVGIIIPTQDMQKRLFEVVSSPDYVKFHNPEYSAISNPMDTTYQNCTEHMLDIIFSAIYKTDDIEKIKINEQAYFQPQPIQVSQLKLMLGSLINKDIRLMDHTNKPATATFGSIARFMEKEQLSKEIFSLNYNHSLASLN
jgi:hypothetical protein